MIDHKRMVKMLLAIGGEKGDENELYREMLPILAARGCDIVRNYELAKEIAHDVLTDVYLNPGKYVVMDNPFNYIFGSNIHRAMNNQRDAYSHLAEDLNDAVDVAGSLSVEEHVEHKMVIDSIMRILNKEERAIFALRMYSDLSHKEIAQILEIPSATVRSKYVRSLKKVGKFWDARQSEGKGE